MLRVIMGRTVEIRMAYVHVVDALPRETRCNLLAFFLYIKYYWHELFNVPRGDIIFVRALNERFALEI
jgi:hypothetical protein